VQTLREAALLVRHLLSGCTEAFNGEIFQHPAKALLQPVRANRVVPITIGTWGAATATMAGDVADEIKVGGSANPSMVRIVRPIRGTRAVGICLGAVSVVDEDREVARALARRELAMYLPVVAGLDPGTDPEWLARILTADARHDKEAIVREISDDLLNRFAFAGCPNDLVRQVEDIAAAGATRVEFGTPLGRDPMAAIGLLGERVLPAFR